MVVSLKCKILVWSANQNNGEFALEGDYHHLSHMDIAAVEGDGLEDRGAAMEILDGTSTVVLNECTIHDAKADQGGAIYVVSGATLRATKCRFENNATPNEYPGYLREGGAIYFESDCTAHFIE